MKYIVIIMIVIFILFVVACKEKKRFNVIYYGQGLNYDAAAIQDSIDSAFKDEKAYNLNDSWPVVGGITYDSTIFTTDDVGKKYYLHIDSTSSGACEIGWVTHEFGGRGEQSFLSKDTSVKLFLGGDDGSDEDYIDGDSLELYDTDFILHHYFITDTIKPVIDTTVKLIFNY